MFVLFKFQPVSRGVMFWGFLKIVRDTPMFKKKNVMVSLICLRCLEEVKNILPNGGSKWYTSFVIVLKVRNHLTMQKRRLLSIDIGNPSMNNAVS